MHNSPHERTSGQNNLTKGCIAAAHGDDAPFCQSYSPGGANVHLMYHMLSWPIRVHNPNGILNGSAMFAQLTAECRQACPCMSFPLKIAPSHGAIWTPSNTWFLEPTLAQNPNCISIGSAVFAQLTTERPYTLQRTVLPLCRISDTTTLRLIIKPDSNNNNSHNCNQT